VPCVPIHILVPQGSTVEERILLSAMFYVRLSRREGKGLVIKRPSAAAAAPRPYIYIYMYMFPSCLALLLLVAPSQSLLRRQSSTAVPAETPAFNTAFQCMVSRVPVDAPSFSPPPHSPFTSLWPPSLLCAGIMHSF
jgi:hypothetical protein